MRLIFIFLGVVFLTTNTTYGIQMHKIDGEYVASQDDHLKKKWDAALGSFQFEILTNHMNSRNFQIDMTIIYEIEANRHATEVKYLEYNDFIRIKILPSDLIIGHFERVELIRYVDHFENI